MAFSSLARILEECSTIHAACAAAVVVVVFFGGRAVETSSHTLIPLFMPGSVHKVYWVILYVHCCSGHLSTENGMVMWHNSWQLITVEPLKATTPVAAWQQQRWFQNQEHRKYKGLIPFAQYGSGLQSGIMIFAPGFTNVQELLRSAAIGHMFWSPA